MEDSKTSLFDLSGMLREYCSILVNAMDRIDSEPIEMPMANKIFRDLLDIGQCTHGLLDGPQLLQQLEISTREILKLSIPQRNDLYSLIFERLTELFTVIAENPKFENNSQIIQTSRGEHNISDSIHDFRTKIGNFYLQIFQPSFQPFMTGITIEYNEQNQKLEKMLGNIEHSEDRPATAAIQKLQWEGQKNQMYWVLNHLKGQGLISNSYEQLAFFLRQCVMGFEETAHITITTELSRGKPPTKSKRPNLSELPPPEQEGKN